MCAISRYIYIPVWNSPDKVKEGSFLNRNLLVVLLLLSGSHGHGVEIPPLEYHTESIYYGKDTDCT